MGRLPQNPPTPRRQVGTMYPDFRDEPGPQDRDSPQDLLIAPGILMRLVPGSPAATYLGGRSPPLKLVGTILEHFCEPLEGGGQFLHRDVSAWRRWRRA
jgi:hypothetical protein